MILNQIKGAEAELIVAQCLVSMGYFVFSPVVSMQGPVDLIAIGEEKQIYLIDAKYDAQRIMKGRKKPSRIYRVRTPLQKKLGVKIAYVNTSTRDVRFVPSLE
tara:strand:- start:617 stop:925 length:309 start_codon:yes stop_codon:yes gene_type:complete